jgi:DNA-binding protein HU-beta
MSKTERKSGVHSAAKRRACRSKLGREPRKSAPTAGKASGKKLTKSMLERFLVHQFGFARPKAKVLWKCVVKKLRRDLVSGATVYLPNIGNLEVFEKRATVYRHPGTGELRTAPASRHVRFTIAQSLKGDLNKRSKT